MSKKDYPEHREDWLHVGEWSLTPRTRNGCLGHAAR